MANFRPLQPAPMEEQPPHPSRAMLTQKPKRTVTLGACVACRRRKSKCDGSRPTCTCCVQKDTECVYELGPNEKPSQAMKRKNEEMQGELSNLRQLYDFLRLRPEQEALEIFKKIRTVAPNTTPSQRIQELADFARRGDASAPPPADPPPSNHYEPTHPLTLPPLRLALDSSDPSAFSFPKILALGPDEASSQRHRHTLGIDVSARSDNHGTVLPRTSIQALLHPSEPAAPQTPSDPRLLAAKRWTNVTKDENFLALLLSAWNTWEHSYYHFLDWDIFLDDMSDGRTDFCSELLVNAILATASFHSPLVKDRSKPFSDNIMTQFYQEAERLWDQGQDEETLPRLQAALCLFMVLGKHGRDRDGHGFLLEACRIARSLGLFRLSPPVAQRPRDVPEEKWSTSRAVTAWALFNFQLTISFTYSFPALLKSQPPLAIPYDEDPEREALFRSECARNIIILECSNAIVDPEESTTNIPPKAEQIEVLYLRLKSWFETRPESVNSDKFPSLQNLLTTMQHHVSVVRIFQPFLDHESSNERLKTYSNHARSVTSASIKELRRLLALQEARHGWANAIPLVLHPIMVTSFGSLEEVGRQDLSFDKLKNEPYQGILTCLRALGTLSSYVFYGQPLFRLLTQTCQAMRIPLPPEILTTLDYYQSEEWTKQAVNVVKSRYIADIRRSASDVDNGRMDNIISQWSAMTLDDEGTQESETDCKSA